MQLSSPTSRNLHAAPRLFLRFTHRQTDRLLFLDCELNILTTVLRTEPFTVRFFQLRSRSRPTPELAAIVPFRRQNPSCTPAAPWTLTRTGNIVCVAYSTVSSSSQRPCARCTDKTLREPFDLTGHTQGHDRALRYRGKIWKCNPIFHRTLDILLGQHLPSKVDPVLQAQAPDLSKAQE